MAHPTRADYPPHVLAEIEAESIDADRVRELIDAAAEIAVKWRMQVWGDGRGAWLYDVLRAAIAERVGENWDARPAPRPATKKAITNATRLRIFKRDAYECQQCGSREDLSVDHIHPESRGGSHDDENLQTLCRLCNSRKGVRVP